MWGEGGTETALEQTWTDIVRSHESMLKTQRHQQEALWELLNTELTYINKLKIAKDLVLAALSHCHGNGFLQEVTPTMLFSNLPSILYAHQLFWQEVMYPILQEVRLTGQPFDPMRLEGGCLQFPERFSAYFKYCWEEEINLEFTRRQLDTNPQFHTYLMWVENHPQCGRMRLGDIQAKPHQRITKYPLLLKAVLKTTEDLPTQNALHRMLNSVNNFLESINDYLQVKEDELALSVAAQRIEGYKIEGLSEEIDKHVREYCYFDLMTPLRGVGPKVIRKQLLEETLKVRGRKDNKELVVLLFTDVLLMTKTQKKSDKLKVVRPPLPLEKIHCIELKDGNSFVLVEVGDLGCAVSVYCLSTPSPDSCSSWLSALREAQMALYTLRKTDEANKTLKTTDETELNGLERTLTECELATKVKADSTSQSDSYSDFHPLKQMESISENGTQTLKEVEKSNVQQVVEGKSSPLIDQQNGLNHSAHGRVAKKDESVLTALEDSKTEGRKRSNSNGKQWEDGDAPFKKITERRVTWNSKNITQRDLLVKNQSNIPQSLLTSGHTEINDTFSQPTPSTSLSNKYQTQYGVIAEIDLHLQDEETKRKSLYSQSEEDDGFLTESGMFSRKMKSPRLRRKRPNNSQPSVSPDSSRMDSGEDGSLDFAPKTNSDVNQPRDSNPSIKPQDTYRVLKLGSLKNNQSVLWQVPEVRPSPDLQTPFKHEQTDDGNLQTKPKLKGQRWTSIQNPSSFLPDHRLSPSPPPGLDHQLHPSPLQDLLQRAKEREKERGFGKREGKAKGSTFSLQNSPTLSASPIPSASDGEREVEEEESGVRSMIYAWSWREGNVDRYEDVTNESNNVPEGISVDWPGWCFDDEEVFDFQDFDEEDWFDQTLTTNDPLRSEPKRSDRQDYGECSEV
ncbi:pleckstrin homology domain-containing family G member 5-like isoform X2 [Xyrauchen texanus]|nr:pleckstrin homology domain-containing family G member 5-like isoform X2 [Xyrauchen texanus]